jgi:hypothetical protein
VWDEQVIADASSSVSYVTMASALDVTREQFSDMLRLWEARWFKEFRFTLGEEADGSWPIHSWGMVVPMT